MGVSRRVPTPDREVDAATKCQAVVYHHQLLVVRRAHLMAPIERKRQPWVCHGPELVGRHELALERVDDREVPAQDVDSQLGTLLKHVVEEVEQGLGKLSRFFGHQHGACVHVPTDDVHRVLGGKNRRAQRSEIGSSVDQQRDAVRVQGYRASASGRQDVHISP
jgi:hypothetical protein